MEFCPRLHGSAFFLGKLSSQGLDRIHPIDRHELLIVGMKVRPVMGPTGFRKHTNDDPEEARDLRHRAEMLPCRGSLLSDSGRHRPSLPNEQHSFRSLAAGQEPRVRDGAPASGSERMR